MSFKRPGATQGESRDCTRRGAHLLFLQWSGRVSAAVTTQRRFSLTGPVYFGTRPVDYRSRAKKNRHKVAVEQNGSQRRRLFLPGALLVTIRLQALPALVLVHLQTTFLFEIAHK
jgi:hypothetical protein